MPGDSSPHGLYPLCSQRVVRLLRGNPAASFLRVCGFEAAGKRVPARLSLRRTAALGNRSTKECRLLVLPSSGNAHVRGHGPGRGYGVCGHEPSFLANACGLIGSDRPAVIANFKGEPLETALGDERNNPRYLAWPNSFSKATYCMNRSILIRINSGEFHAEPI